MNIKNTLTATAFSGLLLSGHALAVDPFVLPTPENNPNASYSLYPDAQGNMRQAIIEGRFTEFAENFLKRAELDTSAER